MAAFPTDDSEENYVMVEASPETSNMAAVLDNSYSIALATLTNDTSDTTYRCTFDLNFAVTGNMASVYNPGDGNDGQFYIYDQTMINNAITSGANQLVIMQTAMQANYYAGAPISGTYPITVDLNGSDASTSSKSQKRTCCPD